MQRLTFGLAATIALAINCSGSHDGEQGEADAGGRRSHGRVG